MSIQSDVITALAGVASDRVYPEAAPQDAVLPIVIYKRAHFEPLMTLTGYAGTTKSTFVFECWGTTKAEALSIADSVTAAIDAAAGITIKFREPIGGENYESQSDQYVEPVSYSFWHS